LEFNKEMLGNYNISPKNVDLTEALSLQKDEKGIWTADGSDHLPAWFNEISMYVHFAIEENEAKDSSGSGIFKYASPF